MLGSTSWCVSQAVGAGPPNFLKPGEGQCRREPAEAAAPLAEADLAPVCAKQSIQAFTFPWHFPFAFRNPWALPSMGSSTDVCPDNPADRGSCLKKRMAALRLSWILLHGYGMAGHDMALEPQKMCDLPASLR
jgi:hypothetical protein